VFAAYHLDGDIALEQSVFPEKHFAHSAAAELRLDHESIDTVARKITERDGWMGQADHLKHKGKTTNAAWNKGGRSREIKVKPGEPRPRVCALIQADWALGTT